MTCVVAMCCAMLRCVGVVPRYVGVVPRCVGTVHGVLPLTRYEASN